MQTSGWQNRVIPLVGGMDDETADGQRPDQILYRLLNARVTKTGEIRKRYGFENLSTTVLDELTASRTLVNLDGSNNGFTPRSLITNADRKNGESADALLLLSEGALFKYTASGWLPKDMYFSSATEGRYTPTAAGCGVEAQRVLRDVYDHHDAVSAANGSYCLTAWIESSSSTEVDPRLWYSVYDLINGDFIVGAKAVESTNDVLYCQAIGDEANNKLGLVYVQGANLKIIDLSSPLAPSTATISTDIISVAAATGNPLPFYIAPAHTSGQIVVIFRKNSVNELKILIIDYSGTTQDSTDWVLANTCAVAIEYDSTSARYVCVAGTTAGDMYSRILNSALDDQVLDLTHDLANTVPVRISLGFDSRVLGATAGTTRNVWIVIERAASGGYRRTDLYTRSTADVVVNDRWVWWDATLLSTVFKHNNQLYVTLGYGPRAANGTTVQGHAFVVAIGTHYYNASQQQMIVAGKFGRTIACGHMDDRRFDIKGPPSRVSYSSTTKKWYCGHRIKTRYVEQGGGTFAKVDFAKSCFLTYDFNVGTSHVNVNDITYFTDGSVLKQFDGDKVTEAGFFLFPEISASNVTVSAGAGSLSAGSYSWRFYYETNIGGKRVRSYAMTYTSAAVVANDRYNFTIPSLRFTQRGETEVYIVGYRTAVNPTSTSAFYRITSLAPSASGGIGWYDNDWSNPSVTIQDTLSDANLILEQDYISAGEIAHSMPDIRVVAKHGNRVVGASNDTIYPSLLFSPVNAVEFSDETGQEISDAGGPITALASLGSTLVVFKKQRTFLLAGEGPDNTGNGTFSVDYETLHQSGAKNGRVVCKIPGGVCYGNDDGIFVLTESFQPVFIGKQIQPLLEYLTNTPSRICYNPTDKAIYVLTASAAFADTNIFVFFTETQQWTVWDYNVNFKVYDIAVYNGVLVALTVWCTVCKQGTTAWQDTFQSSAGGASTVSYTYGFITDFINIDPGDPATQSRVKSAIIVGNKNETQGTATVSVAYDNDSGHDWRVIEPPTLNNPQTVDNTIVGNKWEYFFNRQKMSNVRIKYAALHQYEGPYITHIVLRTKPSKNSSKLAPAET